MLLPDYIEIEIVNLLQKGDCYIQKGGLHIFT